MKKIAYGRFVLVHAGHEKLFEASGLVVVSNPADYHLAMLNRLYGRKFLGRNGSPFSWMGALRDQCGPIELVVGQDNQVLANRLLINGLIDSILLVERPLGSPSSSAIRWAFEQGVKPETLLAQGVFTSEASADYAYKRYQEGF